MAPHKEKNCSSSRKKLDEKTRPLEKQRGGGPPLTTSRLRNYSQVLAPTFEWFSTLACPDEIHGREGKCHQEIPDIRYHLGGGGTLALTGVGAGPGI